MAQWLRLFYCSVSAFISKAGKQTGKQMLQAMNAAGDHYAFVVFFCYVLLICVGMLVAVTNLP
jgi:hypothetical protein